MLDSLFHFKQLGSSLRTEIFAGISTFLALSYIFVVNPAILSAGGMDKSIVFFATIVGSVLATLAMGLWANKPFAVAPGLEMNAYIAYVVVGTLGFSWQGALGAVFWSGVLTVVCSLTSIRVRILDAIPDKLKSGLAASVGVFLVLIALKVNGLLVYHGVHLAGFGSFISKEAIIFYAGLILVVVFRLCKVRGAVLLSIIGASIVAHYVGLHQDVTSIHLSRGMFAGFGALHFSAIINPKIWSVVIILFILDFYGSIAKFIGLTRNTSIVDSSGNVPKLKEALLVDGIGTVLGAGLGTSNLITYVESAVGIGEGGRTGLVALVCALLMSLFLLLVPALNLIPVVATTGALLYVGLTLLPINDWRSYSWIDASAVLGMILVTVITFGLDKAMAAGFGVFVVLYISSGRWRQLNWYLVGSAMVLFLSVLLS